MTDSNTDIEEPTIESLVQDIKDMDGSFTTFQALDDAGQGTMKAAQKTQTYALVAIARALAIQTLNDADGQEEEESPLPFPVGLDYQCNCGGIVRGKDRGADGLIPCKNCGYRFDTITNEQVGFADENDNG